MKIFKNRGDIYISKSDYKSSKEERILLILLALIVVFTVVFFVILNSKYSSVKEFFGSDDVTTTQIVEEIGEELPEISGRKNFLIFETDSAQSDIHYIFLIQADRDNLSYKVCTLSPDMKLDGETIYSIFSTGGGASLQTKLTSFLGVNIDYYAAFTSDNFTQLVNKLGSFEYTSNEAIKYDNAKNKNDTYSVRIKKGTQSISGTELSELLRYYSEDNTDYEKANQIMLYALVNLINEDNFEDSQALFRLFINSATTNITVRNFQDGYDALNIFSRKNSEITVYAPLVSTDSEKNITPESMREIKGYFSE